MSIEYYSNILLLCLRKKISKSLRIDNIIKDALKGKYASMEVDLIFSSLYCPSFIFIVTLEELSMRVYNKFVFNVVNLVTGREVVRS